MKKLIKLLSVLTMFGLLFIIFPKTVNGADDVELPKGVLVTDDKGVSLTKTEGYFFNLTDLFPGHQIKREIEVKNNRSEAVGISIDIIPITFSGPINLIKMVEMKMIYEDQVIFDGNLVNQDKEIYEQGSSIHIGKVPPNSEKKIMVELYVSPDILVKDLLNETSEAIVRWDVKASAEDIDEPTVKPLDKTPGIRGVLPRTGIRGFLPKTGERLTYLLSILALLSLMLVAYVYRK